MRPNWFIALRCQVDTWYSEMLASTLPPPRVRTFSPDDLHLTVAFLGAVEAHVAEQAFRGASSWPTGALEVSLDVVRPLGPKRRFSALSATLDTGRAEVEEGMAACTNAMRTAAGLGPESRPPLAHMTIARPERRASARERGLALQWAAALPVAGQTVRIGELALYTWAEDRRHRLFRIARSRSLCQRNALRRY
ncbi:MAG: hypothetical protein AAF458_01705 [Pseudomonadota bacterium]